VAEELFEKKKKDSDKRPVFQDRALRAMTKLRSSTQDGGGSDRLFENRKFARNANNVANNVQTWGK
jgi:hypothetical protein